MRAVPPWPAGATAALERRDLAQRPDILRWGPPRTATGLDRLARWDSELGMLPAIE
ncbi:hypothetical protein [Salinactinospora qingdaonensis]|uniref:hypothetical protein n=1 Tax=Salinactinospora qingdaonensis TaxID=702744 RepID=UPI0031EA6DE2